MKVKGIQIKFNILAVLIAVVYVAIMVLFNVGYAKISVATIDGSYASEFADKKKLNKIDITDNQKMYFDVRYENFEYNENSDGTICLESYKGNSESVVIPSKLYHLNFRYNQNSHILHQNTFFGYQ